MKILKNTNSIDDLISKYDHHTQRVDERGVHLLHWELDLANLLTGTT